MSETSRQARAISEVCHCLSSEGPGAARAVLEKEYPFTSPVFSKRRYGPSESAKVFVRDGFIDRYSGDQLIYPPVLRILSAELPDDFPFHPNWKTDVTHSAYWEVGATVDHLVPVTLGGPDDESNWVTTSMARNSAKMNWLLEDLGWELHEPGDVADWDGMLGWFVAYVDQHPDHLNVGNVRQWYRGAVAATDNSPT